MKGASRDSNLGLDGRAASGNAQRAKVASPNVVPAGSGGRASRARRRVQFSSSDRCVPSSRKDFESCFEARTCDSDLVPCLSVSAVSVGSSRCFMCSLWESCTHVVSVCVHDSELI